MNQLPETWALVELGEVADISSGVGFPKEYQGQTSGDLPFYKVGDISRAVQHNQGVLGEAEHYVSQAVARKLRGKPLAPGTTVFAKIGEAIKLNRRGYVQKPCLVDNNVMAVKAREYIDDRLVYYYLQTVDFADVSRSTTVPSLRKGDVEGLLFPLPPLPEQQRIADKLDELLARVDGCRARLGRVPALVKRLRQAVLAAAVEGRLTADWREENGGGTRRTSYSDLTIGVSNVAECPDGWQVMPIGEIITLIDGDRGPNYPKQSDYQDDGHCLFLSTKNVREYGFLFDDLVFISEEKHSILRNGTLERGDVVVTTRGTLGNVAVYDDTVPYKVVRINSGMLIMRSKKQLLFSKYLMLFVASPQFAFQIEQKRSGSAQPQLPAGVLKTFMVAVPPFPEQHEIVRRVEALFAFADRLAARTAVAQARVEQLTPSLLGKAFRGELVETTAD